MKVRRKVHPVLAPMMSAKRFDEIMELGEGILWQTAVGVDGQESVRALSPEEIANNFNLDVPASLLNDDVAFLRYLELKARGIA